MNPQEIDINRYSYDLPDERIARFPIIERDASRLLFFNGTDISDHYFRDLAALLPNESLLVRNNTRVIRARLLFRKESGARIEIFCLEPVNPQGYEESLSATGQCTWRCLIGNAKRWKTGVLQQTFATPDGLEVCLSAERLADSDTEKGYPIVFRWTAEVSFGEILEQMGILPIPPYLERETTESDNRTYQTVYARQEGSVAAPTAGLHFTPAVLDRLTQSGIPILDITLHVGAGTFLPVKSQTMAGHRMHRETVTVSAAFIRMLTNTDRRIIAVGTTSVRTLESLYFLGKRILRHPEQDPIAEPISQWEPYEDEDHRPTADEALNAVYGYMHTGNLATLCFHTEILIAPGYRFRLVKGLITNFHQPHSTLILLVAAFIGEEWHNIYRHALARNYRFLSYGDSSLLLPSEASATV